MTKKNDAKDNPDEQKEAPEAEAQVETADSEVTAVLEDESLKERDKIRKLSEMGFSNPQIIELGFTRSEVYRACSVNRKGLTSRADGFSLPAVLKAGGGIEVVSPEAILQSIFPQANADMQSLMKGMMLYRAAQMAVLRDAYASAALFGSTYITLTGVVLVWSVGLFPEIPSAGLGAGFLLIAVGQAIGSPAAGALAATTSPITAFFAFAGVAVLTALVRPHPDL